MDFRFLIFDFGSACRVPADAPVDAPRSFVANRKSKIANPRGFTMVEMLVTCALMVVLMLACTQIFSIASKTIGGGQAMGAATRDAQAAQAVFARDFASTAPPTASPVFYIHSDRRYAFRNVTDQLTDGSVGSYDFGNGDNAIPPAIYNFRNHRIDTLGFFAIDRFTRQTGDTALVDPGSSREAWIWYGHLSLANDDATPTYYGPGDSDASATNKNQNNFYASQWTLGRVAILMKDPASITGNGYIPRDASGNLTPIAFSKTDNTRNALLSDFRFDVGGATMARFRQDVLLASAPLANMIFDNGTTVPGIVGRFRANPFQLRPLDAAAAAQQVPIFVPACTQFIVEFAGDFIAQDSNGDPLDTNGDGDFTNDTDGVIDYVKGTSQIRWYGLPRDTNGDGAISATQGDVAPVRDIIPSTSSKPKPDFERALPAASTNYATEATLNRYIAAWDANDQNRPKMIRITLGIDRPEAEGKLLDGLSFEYVFNVGY